MLSEDEASLLYRLAAEAHFPIVEIGSYRGRSTVALALGSRAGTNVPVYAIDPHEDATEPGGFHFGRADAVAFTHAIMDASVADIVRVVQMPASAVVFNGTIGLLWIDGDHEAALRDFNQFGWQVPVGGVVAFHDRELPNVRAAITAAHQQGFRLIETCVGIAALERGTYD